MIEFGVNDVKLVCFDSISLTEDAIEIAGPDDMPETWLEGHEWQELNILPEAYLEPDDNRNPRANLKRLYYFVRAFGFRNCEVFYMHVWKSRLPKIS